MYIRETIFISDSDTCTCIMYNACIECEAISVSLFTNVVYTVCYSLLLVCVQVRGVSESTHCVLLSALNQLMCMLD